MREVTRDEKFPNDPKEGTVEELPGLVSELTVEDLQNLVAGIDPTEAELVTVALLMRLYDINMEILRHFDAQRADEVYELHEQGGTANPPIFVPEVARETGTRG